MMNDKADAEERIEKTVDASAEMSQHRLCERVHKPVQRNGG
jgi:hypothetical protein